MSGENKKSVSRLMLYVTNRETKKGNKSIKFKSYTTKMNIEVIDENGESKGKQKKYVTIKFAEELDERVKDLSRGIITAYDEDLNVPSRYKVKINDDGTKTYPCIWVNNFISFEPKPFVVKGDFVLEDEEETEDVTIDEESND